MKEQISSPHRETTGSPGAGLSRWVGAGLAVFLLLVAMLRAAATISPGAADAASLAGILVGVGWALRGPDRLRRLAGLYLWLAFIVAVSLLQRLTDSLARWTGWDELLLLQGASILHLLGTAASLGALGAWFRRSTEGSDEAQPARLAAGVLIFGAVVFWIGARTFPGTELEAVAANLAGHLWTAGCFLIATVITLLGLGLLTQALRAAGDRTLSLVGLTTFLFGAVFWFLHLAFRLTAMRSVAEEFGRTAIVPAWYPPVAEWVGLLFGIYSVLAYLAMVAYGTAFLRTGLVPRWVGWSCVVVALLAAPFAGPPLFIHLLLWFVGLVLLEGKLESNRAVAGGLT